MTGKQKTIRASKIHTNMKPIKSYILQYIPKAVLTPGCSHNYTINTFFVTSYLLGRVLLFSADHLLIYIHFPSLWTRKNLRL